VVPVTYDLVLEGVDAAKVEMFAAGGLEENFPVRHMPALAVTPLGIDNSGVLPADVPTVQWSGEVVLEGLTELRSALDIAPGTRVRLGPGASLIVRGRVTIRGTAGRPVLIERLQPDHPWGTFALVGPGANGSSLEYCLIRGGSGLVSPYTLFSGMVSVRNAEVRLEHCQIEDNTGFDDLFHAAYSSIEIVDCVFRQAVRDGVDLDICQGRLLRTTISHTGNDALDLMTSEVVVSQCRLQHSGDKGISAGEACKVVVLDSRLENNPIGIQVKDGSQALLYNATLQGNGIHLAAYHKNRSYSGVARLTLAKSSVSSVGQLCKLEDQSTLSVLDSQLPTPSGNPLVSTDLLTGAGAAPRSDGPTEAFGRLLPGAHWKNAAPRHRGSLLPAMLVP
jgi:hypothetical protein